MSTLPPEDGVRSAQINGLRLCWMEEGEGPLLVLVHGFPDTAHTWDELRPRFAAAGYRVVTPFLRGYAPSEAPETDQYSYETLGLDVVGLIEALGEREAVIVGHDWGAAACYAAASLRPDRVRRLVTLAIPHLATFRMTWKKAWGARHFLTLRLPGAVARFAAEDYAALRVLYARWSPGFDWPDAEFVHTKAAFAVPGCLNAALGYYRQLQLEPPPFLRKRIEVPTLVLGGQTDGVADEEDFQRSLRKLSADSRVQMIPGGHFAHREHPDAFFEAVMGFLGPGQP